MTTIPQVYVDRYDRNGQMLATGKSPERYLMFFVLALQLFCRLAMFQNKKFKGKKKAYNTIHPTLSTPFMFFFSPMALASI